MSGCANLNFFVLFIQLILSILFTVYLHLAWVR
jgi:hypothetical protein